jgi:hypothetical protein
LETARRLDFLDEKKSRMKDTTEIWIVLREGSSLRTAIRCEGGKMEAKELRKEMQLKHGGAWKSLKTTKKEFASAT